MPDRSSQGTIVLHGTKLSGHAHRVELLLRMLGLPYQYRDSPASVRATPEFRALNPFGQIPVLQDGGLVLADSNAILVYLAKRYDTGGEWLPEEPVVAAQVQRWLSVAAGDVRFGPSLARAVTLWGFPGDAADGRRVADALLRFMEGHLAERVFLAAEHPTVADLACCSYVAHAPEGGVSLAAYPAVRAWLQRIEALPGFEPMPRSPVPAAA